MRILAVQFKPAPHGRRTPRFEAGLATVLALLRERGHAVSLLGVSRFELEPLKHGLAAALPQLIYADIASGCSDAAQRTLQYLSREQFLPIVAGGRHATVDPDGCLSIPGVTAVAPGEPEAALLAYLDRLGDPAVGQTVRGIWTRDERGLARPPLPEMIEDLDSLPFAERALFDQVPPGDMSPIPITVGRGDHADYGHTINAAARALYGHPAHWARRRSVESVLDEIELLGPTRRGRELCITDRDLDADAEWLESFLRRVPASAAPWRCMLTAKSHEPELLSSLARAGCRGIRVEVLAGGDFVRNDVFQIPAGQAELAALFDHARAAGLEREAFILAGAPYESEESLSGATALLTRLAPDWLDARPYYPVPGTTAAALARENGWLHPRGQEQLHAELPGIEMPACRIPIVINALRAWRKRWPSLLAARANPRSWLA